METLILASLTILFALALIIRSDRYIAITAALLIVTILFILRAYESKEVLKTLKSNPEATLICSTGLPFNSKKTYVEHWKLLDKGQVLDTRTGEVFNLSDCRVVKLKK